MNKFSFLFFLSFFCFSEALHTEELDISYCEDDSPLILNFENKLSQRSFGLVSVSKTITEARDNLNKKGVLSKVFPDQLVTSIFPLEIIHRLLVLENSSTKDFVRGDFSTLYNHIGKHGFGQLSLKVSPANAKGVMQITQNGFDHMVGAYKSARIFGSFDFVTKSPVSSVEVAILFVDNALSVLNIQEREKIFSDKSLLHNYVATAYNAGAGYALKNLRNGTLFFGGRNKETKIYVTNMRSLVSALEDLYL